MFQLLELGEPLVPGKIRDSNRTTLLALLRDHNYHCIAVLIIISGTMFQLLELGEPLVPGKIRDSNRTTLLALLRDHNYHCIDLGIAKDT